MSKFSKNLRKMKKHPINCVVLGTAFGNIDSLLETFGTVVILGASQLVLRQKNIIYITDVSYISTIHDIDMIFVDQDKLEDMKFLTPILNRWRPIIFIEGAEIISNEHAECLRPFHYQVVELEKNYQLWKPKK